MVLYSTHSDCVHEKCYSDIRIAVTFPFSLVLKVLNTLNEVLELLTVKLNAYYLN